MFKKILVIEDEPEIVRMLKSRLEANNYAVDSASDGVDGLKHVESEKPDLIILDIMMPGMDGYTFLKNLKHKPSGHQIPVIVLTAKSEIQDLFELEGVTDYVVKPYEPQNLLERVQKHLGH
ncbi:MAG: hypothetical protein A3C35_03215 [Omnitrophica bacterium RIFCSPHIGHO2_02_FULL_46_11]|nr:MAG: hypothetical protein A3C35_03215 [Omnitrophica bacterium RIFCSPHIGHO2_02_FULL_46_11]OGW87542.1 MAG: hypothetical protein A3A81_03220 [Omnitrophica bacterium RIFCSPLOWO2_01_FULL_45_10b]